MIALQQIFVAVMSSPNLCCFSRESSVSKHSVRLPCKQHHAPTDFVSRSGRVQTIMHDLCSIAVLLSSDWLFTRRITICRALREENL